MKRAVAVRTAGTWTPPPEAGTITLPYDQRHRRRIRMEDDRGLPFLLDLPNAVLLADGDGLEMEDGGVVMVKAARERVADLHFDRAMDAMRVAWHVGNRHTAVQVLSDRTLRIAHDHVLVAMAEGLGARAEELVAPFQPEGGAYASGHGHAHSHGHGHGHGHGHEQGHGHGHTHGH
ncbi:MAG: urease accessory protein UreE [Rhodobacterales bacterium]|nr:urease accessory protein UreE [Rhodobacterales bacterium]